ncbi:MAG: dockerin type I domain-containing protein [Bacillota bacterium]
MFKSKISILLIISLLMVVVMPIAAYGDTTDSTSEPIETYVKYTPYDEQVSVSISKDKNGEYIATVDLEFYTAGYKVTYDGTVTSETATLADGSEMVSFIGTADIERWTGDVIQVLTYETLTYNLGILEPGNYEFVFSSNGFKKSCPFTVRPSITIPGDYDNPAYLKRLIVKAILTRNTDGMDIERLDFDKDGEITSNDLAILNRTILGIYVNFPEAS